MAELLIRLAVIGTGCVAVFAFSTLGYAIVYEFRTRSAALPNATNCGKRKDNTQE